MKNNSVLLISRNVEGGMKTHLEVLIRGLVKENLQVYLVIPRNNLRLPPQVRIVILSIPEIPYNPSALSSIYILMQLINEEHFGIIHTHGYAAGITGRLAAIWAGKKEIIHTVHNFLPAVSPILTVGGRFAEKQLSKHSKKIITVSKQLLASQIEIGIAPDKLITIYNGIEATKLSLKDKSKARAMLGLAKQDHVIGTICRLIPSKGIDIFLQALAQLNKTQPVKGLIIGDGPLKIKLQNLTQMLGIENEVLFLGQRENISELLSALDIFILPSRQEGFGLTLVESQWLGLPVIASDTGGIKEIIQHNINGLLFTPSEFMELFQKISSLLSNEQLKNKLATNGAKSARLMFSADKMINSTLQIYSQFM
jgi:glycosyltransferase involved in cell wall biosynthesis